jgi:hypothetical protein
MSERSYKNHEQNGNTNRRRRTAIKVGSIIAGGVAATGLILGIGGEVAVATESRGPSLNPEKLTDPEKYVRSDERNKQLSEKFDDISARVLAHSKEDSGVVYEAKGEGWGELTSKVQAGNITYTLKLNVSKNDQSRSNPYTVEREHKGMTLTVDSQVGPDEFRASSARFGQEFKAENDFIMPWTTEAGSGFHNSQGQGAGGSAEASPESAAQGNMPVDEMVKIDGLVLQQADFVATGAGI